MRGDRGVGWYRGGGKDWMRQADEVFLRHDPFFQWAPAASGHTKVKLVTLAAHIPYNPLTTAKMTPHKFQVVRPHKTWVRFLSINTLKRINGASAAFIKLDYYKNFPLSHDLNRRQLACASHQSIKIVNTRRRARHCAGHATEKTRPAFG